MSDGDGFSLFAGAAQGTQQLLADRSDFRDIVEEFGWRIKELEVKP